MSLCPMQASRQAKSCSPTVVLRTCDCFKVCWIDTGSIAAEMINLEALRDMSNKYLVGIAVASYTFVIGPKVEIPVALCRRTSPGPARSSLEQRAFFIHFLPKALGDWPSLHGWMWLGLASVVNAGRHKKPPDEMEAHSVSHGPPSDTRGLPLIVPLAKRRVSIMVPLSSLDEADRVSGCSRTIGAYPRPLPIRQTPS